MAAMDFWHIECNLKLVTLAGISDQVFRRVLGCAGSDKLGMYGFNIHACIDLGSSFAVYATVDVNKNPDAQLSLFNRGLTVFGYPTVVHTRVLDGAESICEEAEWECGHDSYIFGPHNLATQVDLWARKTHDLCVTDADCDLSVHYKCLHSSSNCRR